MAALMNYLNSCFQLISAPKEKKPRVPPAPKAKSPAKKTKPKKEKAEAKKPKKGEHMSMSIFCERFKMYFFLLHIVYCIKF